MAPKTSDRVPSTVNDFIVLPLRLPAQPSFPTEATHYLYLRPHAPKVPTPTSPQEIFLVNVPIDATERLLRNLFADQLGGPRVEAVTFEGTRVGKSLRAPVAPAPPSKKRKRGGPADDTTTPNDLPLALKGEEDPSTLPPIRDRPLHHSGSTALITFVDRPSAELALKAARRLSKSPRAHLTWPPSSSPSEPPLGAARYHSQHKARFPDPATLSASVDSFMTAFAAHEAACERARTRLRSEPDADGFITVTRGARKGPAREEAVRAQQEELRVREAQRVKADFYRFQVREKRKEEAQGLVREFEEDARRVAEMRRRRGRVRPEEG